MYSTLLATSGNLLVNSSAKFLNKQLSSNIRREIFHFKMRNKVYLVNDNVNNCFDSSKIKATQIRNV